MSKHQKRLLLTAAATGAMAFALSGQAARADLVFTPGDLVVSVEGDGSGTGSYGDNEAAPLTLYEFTTTGMNQTPVGSLELPQTMSGSQFPVSGEYGSSSEATLQLSGNGKYLAIAGYGVNANAFNADPAAFGPDPTNTALGQSGSLTGKSDTPVPRVAALINIDGSISSSTALSNIFDQNNPRSVYTVDGTSFYVSGQGNYPDSTGGVFYATLGSHSATSITGNDAGGGTSQDTRTVLVYNNTLYVSSDSKKGSTNRDYIGTLSPAGGPLPTSVANSGNGPAMLPGFGNSGGTGKVTISKVGGVSNGNTVNAVGDQINLSPSNFFFANADTLYVADTGSPKNTSATSPLGDGGLQKWSFKSGSWTLDYTLSVGLNLVPNSDASGSTGLYGLTGEVVDGGLEVELFATNYTITDTDLALRRHRRARRQEQPRKRRLQPTRDGARRQQLQGRFLRADLLRSDHGPRGFDLGDDADRLRRPRVWRIPQGENGSPRPVWQRTRPVGSVERQIGDRRRWASDRR
jgi:hypothetical protein